MGGVVAQENCLQCGALVWWRVSVLGTRLRLNAAPDPNGNVIIITLPDGKIRADVLTGDRMPAQQQAFRQHQCPKPLLCTGCGKPMRPVDFYLSMGWDEHGNGCPLWKALAAEC